MAVGDAESLSSLGAYRSMFAVATTDEDAASST